MKKQKKKKKVIDFTTVMLTIAIIIVVIALLFSAYRQSAPFESTMKFNEFVDSLDKGEIESVVIIGNKKYFNATLKSGEKVTVIDPDDDTFRRELLESGIDVKVSSQTILDAMTSVLVSIPTIILTFTIMFYIVRTLGTNTNTLYKLYKAEEIVKFDDVAGMSEVKEEVKFAVSQLKNADKLKDLGARPCKGIILEGPPGTGKTLLAKAIAGEADVKFIATSGSDFIEMFAGLGAARVRKLWEMAELNAPCVIFIDEIDAVGRRRSGGGDGATTEANQTLNELLAKMDGLGTSSGIFVVGATNRISDLDPALLRPGRFDKHLYVGVPKTKKDRDEIMNLYLSNKKLDENFDRNKASKLLFDLSGAEIEQALNDAVLVSLQRGGEGIVSMEDLDKSSMKLRANGVEVRQTSMKDYDISVIHESGHAIMSGLLGRKVSKISVTPYNSGVGGMTIRDTDDIEDIKLTTKEELIKDIKVLLAGRAAESIIIGDTSIGCSNDIEKASRLAYHMIYSYAMTDDYLVNPAAINREDKAVLINSDDAVDRVNKLLLEYNKEVMDALTKHKDILKKLADRLATEENIYDFDIDKFTMS